MSPRPAVGIDLVEVAEIDGSLRAFGARFLTRLYTDAERRQCGEDPRRLAACFCAKEAVIKALRAIERPPWTEVEILRRPAGGWTVRLQGTAARLAGGAACTVDVRCGGERCLAVATLG